MSLQYEIFQAVPELDPYFQNLFSKPASSSLSLNARANLATWMCQTCVKSLDWVPVSFLHTLVVLTAEEARDRAKHKAEMALPFVLFDFCPLVKTDTM